MENHLREVTNQDSGGNRSNARSNTMDIGTKTQLDWMFALEKGIRFWMVAQQFLELII